MNIFDAFLILYVILLLATIYSCFEGIRYRVRSKKLLDQLRRVNDLLRDTEVELQAELKEWRRRRKFLEELLEENEAYKRGSKK